MNDSSHAALDENDLLKICREIVVIKKAIFSTISAKVLCVTLPPPESEKKKRAVIHLLLHNGIKIVFSDNLKEVPEAASKKFFEFKGTENNNLSIEAFPDMELSFDQPKENILCRINGQFHRLVGCQGVLDEDGSPKGLIAIYCDSQKHSKKILHKFFKVSAKVLQSFTFTEKISLFRNM